VAETPFHQDARVAAGSRWEETFYPAVARALGGRVLELGCGTGRILAALLEAGVDAHGLDLDPELVQAARERLGRRGHDPDRVAVGDMRGPLRGPFRTAILAHNTAALLDDEALLATLGAVRQAVGPDGRLLLDVELTDHAAFRAPPHRWARTDTVEVEGRSVMVHREGTFEPSTGILTVRERVSGARASTATLRLHARPRAALEALLAQAGWETVGPPRDATGAPVGPASRLWVGHLRPASGR
jgi:SAM-dependent methyltransferase